jgi:hypothetical protein
MTDNDVLILGDYVHGLAKATVREGISQGSAPECCLALANVTVNDAIREVRATRHSNGARQTDGRVPRSSRSFRESVRLILAGVGAEAIPQHPIGEPRSRGLGLRRTEVLRRPATRRWTPGPCLRRRTVGSHRGDVGHQRADGPVPKRCPGPRGPLGENAERDYPTDSSAARATAGPLAAFLRSALNYVGDSCQSARW